MDLIMDSLFIPQNLHLLIFLLIVLLWLNQIVYVCMCVCAYMCVQASRAHDQTDQAS